MTALTGRIVKRGYEGWDIARRGFAQAVDYESHVPKTVVYCANVRDVQNAVRWSRETSTPFRVRSGGHSFEAYSSLVDGGLIIDVSDLDTIQIADDRQTAEIGPGIRMAKLYEQLGQAGVTIPAATDPAVGLGGLALGGGFGVTSRKWGLTCDSVVAMEIVDANGDVIHANAGENPDLFWACRGGGGGNFGIVTKLTFRLQDSPNVALFRLLYDSADFIPVADFWQSWAPNAPDEITAVLMVRPAGGMAIYGQLTPDLGQSPDIDRYLAPLIKVAPPLALATHTDTFAQVTKMLLGLDPDNLDWSASLHGETQAFKSASSFAFEPLPIEALRTLQLHFAEMPRLPDLPSEPSMIQFLPGGGAPSRVAQEASAVYGRDARFLIQYDGYWTAPIDAEPTRTWISNMRNAMLPYTRGAYINYHDAALDNWSVDYHGPNLARLAEVKRRYDPENIFNFPRSIQLSTAPESAALNC